MAGKVTTINTPKEYSTGVKVASIAFTADDTDATITSAILTGCAGKKLNSVIVVNGSTGMTATADVDITDTFTSVNLTATNGDNLGGDSVVTQVAPDTANVIILGNLTVTISSNAVNAATATIYLVFDSKWS